MTEEKIKKQDEMKDVATIKEAFIIDELQKYMDLTKNPPVWIEPVRLRLQEKEDWKRQVREAFNEVELACEDDNYLAISKAIDKFKKELEL